MRGDLRPRSAHDGPKMPFMYWKREKTGAAEESREEKRRKGKLQETRGRQRETTGDHARSHAKAEKTGEGTREAREGGQAAKRIRGETKGKAEESTEAAESSTGEQRHRAAEQTRQKNAFRTELGPERPEAATRGTRDASSAGRSPFRPPPECAHEPLDSQARK